MRGWLVRLPGIQKLLIAAAADAVLLSLSVWLSFFLKFGDARATTPQILSLSLLGLVLGPCSLWVVGLYREITRYIGPIVAIRVLKGTALFVGCIIVASFFTHHTEGIPRTVPAILWAVASLLIGMVRLLARWVILGTRAYKREARVAIYGAGAAGLGLHAALTHARTHQVVAFFDDSNSMIGRSVRGVPVLDGSSAAEALKQLDVGAVLLALPSAHRSRRRQIVDLASQLDIRVLTVPTLAELAEGTARVDQLRYVRVEDLLGRPPVAARADLLHHVASSGCIMVTGAGGSIGSELCRRLVASGVDRLVLLENGEHNLYSIEKELRLAIATQRRDTVLEPVLGSVLDPVLLERLMRQHRVHTVFHAAAYKHVPIVERHESMGVETNTVGTLLAAQAAVHAGVKAFVLISTDKAVRPTSVMGASKRLAEMVLQSMHSVHGGNTTFSMVRFGNVLGSSGSVIPLFREQIERGGPVTVTHPDMVRYFMTIPEAAELVLQAAGMARGGEVFVLDMGDPVRIDDVARNMIRLAGRSIRDAANPSGDIEIIYTGVRPGEKLFEELFIGIDLKSTEHPGIRLANEPWTPWSELESVLAKLRAGIDQRDDHAVREQVWQAIAGPSEQSSRQTLAG
jgi:FlaA1/EpsC-like NDP-sugar epimerase